MDEENLTIYCYGDFGFDLIEDGSGRGSGNGCAAGYGDRHHHSTGYGGGCEIGFGYKIDDCGGGGGNGYAYGYASNEIIKVDSSIAPSAFLLKSIGIGAGRLGNFSWSIHDGK